MRLANPCDGPNGTTVTVANSDDTGGAAFSNVVTGASWTHVYDTSVFHYGTSSIRQNGGSASQCQFTLGFTAVAAVQGAASFRLAAVNVARSLIQGRGASAQRWRIAFLSTGRITVNNAANTVLSTTAGTFSANTFYRTRFDFAAGTTGAYSVSFYDSSDNLIETLSGTGDFTTTQVDEVRFGQIANATGLGNLFWDGAIATDEGLPGPWIGAVTLTPAVVSASAVEFTATPGAVTVNLTPAVVVTSAVPVSAAPLTATVALTPAVVSVSAVALTATPQPVTVALTPAVVVTSAVAVTATPGPVTQSLTPAVITATAVAVTPVPQPVTVALTPAVATLTAVAVTPVGSSPGAVTLTPAVVTVAAVAVTPVPQPVSVSLSPASVAMVAVPVTPVPLGGTVALTPAVAVLSAVPVATTPGVVTTALTPAVLVLSSGVVAPLVPGDTVPPDLAVTVMRPVVGGSAGRIALRARAVAPVTVGLRISTTVRGNKRRSTVEGVAHD